MYYDLLQSDCSTIKKTHRMTYKVNYNVTFYTDNKDTNYLKKL